MERKNLELIERRIEKTYNSRNNKLRLDMNMPFDRSHTDLGYSWKYLDKETNTRVYSVVVAKLGKPDTEFRIKMHEYGHIYFTHFEGIYEELDRNACNLFKNYRGELIQQLVTDCKIDEDFAEALIERVIDDPGLNHTLHNIAMDMEVNSKLLSEEDIKEMERDITDASPKSREELLLEAVKDSGDEKLSKEASDLLDKISKEVKVKLILPSRYHTSDGKPFPNKLTYIEYFMLIVKNLSQFVKMLISITSGGSGDTSEVSDSDLEKALGGGMGSLTDMMRQLGMLDDSSEEKDDSETSGAEEGGRISPHDTSNSGGFSGSSELVESRYTGIREKDIYDHAKSMDHKTDSRDEADIHRSLGKITAGGGVGCGDSGGSGGVRIVDLNVDPVDEAIDEVITSYRNKVIKLETVRDMMKKWNTGRIRTVISSTTSRKVNFKFNPRIVYLIDISSSMDTVLVDRILKTISRKMKSINRGLKYDIITWSTDLGEHIKDISAGKEIPKIHTGGGTRLARGISYFKNNYKEDSTLIVVSDFMDYLEEWNQVLHSMPSYKVYGFNYGRGNFSVPWSRNFTVKNFNESYTKRL